MTFRLRPAHITDLDHLYEMAKLTGGGFTNLPPDKPTLKAKLERAAKAFAREEDTLGDDMFVFEALRHAGRRCVGGGKAAARFTRAARKSRLPPSSVPTIRAGGRDPMVAARPARQYAVPARRLAERIAIAPRRPPGDSAPNRQTGRPCSRPPPRGGPV